MSASSSSPGAWLLPLPDAAREPHRRRDHHAANHGIAWSIYCHDPDGNDLELFVDTDWYFPQPFLVPLDLSQTDEEIHAATEAMCREQPGFEPYPDWRARFGATMHLFRPGV